MIFTTRMIQLIAVVLDGEAEAVTKELLRQGVLDFISVKSLTGDLSSKIDQIAPRISGAKILELRNRIEGLLGIIDTAPDRVSTLSIEELEPINLEEAARYLDGIDRDLEDRRERQKELQQEIVKTADLERQIRMFEDFGGGFQSSSPYSFLTVQTGTVPNRYIDTFKDQLKKLPSVFIESGMPEDPVFLLLTMKRDNQHVDKILESAQWTDTEPPAGRPGIREDVLRDIEIKTRNFLEEQKKVSTDIEDEILKRREVLLGLWKNLTLNELYLRIQTHFGRTARTVLFSGWLPIEKKRDLEAGIRESAGAACWLEWHNPESKDGEKTPPNVPVQMSNPKFLKPFQVLVENYAIPEYGSINPTPFVFVSFLLMFGLMFGDAGHGFVLLLVGILGIFVRRRAEASTILFRLITWCGSASIVSGVLFGSYFGMKWLPPLWFDYHGIIAGHSIGSGPVHSVYDILTITIYFGIAVIGTGLILNWINCIRKKKWTVLFLDKGGLLGGWIYAAGVYIAFYFVRHDYKGLPPGGFILPLVAVPVLLLLLKPPIEYFSGNKHHDGKRFSAMTLMDFFMEWIVEVLEIFSGYLANTLSFMRVAGLGIAHVSLMMAFFKIAEMITPGGGLSFGAVIVLIFGNVLVIVLEGLSAGIQSLRLNYYEFFSKYFSGSGRAYNPISLTKKE
jgi:V/A-type H+/Na+-transporting ATPase subunit I